MFQIEPLDEELDVDPASPEEEALAEELVHEAMAGYEKILSPTVLSRIREFLLNELLCSPNGRRRLRAAMPDPVVEASGDHERVGGTSVPARPRKPGKVG